MVRYEQEFMVRESIYLETSVISYYTAKPSRDIIVAAHQQITWEWWDRCINGFTVFISQLVLDEVSRGDPQAVARRLEAVQSFQLLQTTPLVRELTRSYVKQFNLPARWEADAVHLALASVHEIDYLVTWNCSHIANARVMRNLPGINTAMGVSIPTICTPEEFEEEQDDVERPDR